jgi:flagellar protein FlaG
MEIKNGVGAPVPNPAIQGPSDASKAASPRRQEAKKAPEGAPDTGNIKKAAREALKADAIAGRELRIEFESDLHRIVVKVMDKESGEVIRQIPTAEEIANAKHIKEQLSRMVRDQSGFAVDQEV